MIRTLSRWLLSFVGVTAVWCSWCIYDWHKHQILVLLHDGSVADRVSITLDYDPVSDYHPTLIDGMGGRIYIPKSKAYGRGWEIMKISARSGDKRYSASRSPSECRYPMIVTLEELPPDPPPSNPLEQSQAIRKVLKAVVQ